MQAFARLHRLLHVWWFYAITLRNSLDWYLRVVRFWSFRPWHKQLDVILRDGRVAITCGGCGKLFGDAPPLHVYECDSGGATEWFVAFDEDDAHVVVLEYLVNTVGETADAVSDYYPDGIELTLCADDKEATFHHRDDGEEVESLIGDGVYFRCPSEDGCVVEIRTYAEHARLAGRGMWATTEY